MNSQENVYNINKYTDTELYNILDLINPSDRELEAKIFASKKGKHCYAFAFVNNEIEKERSKNTNNLNDNNTMAYFYTY